ncbi:ribosomal protein S6--L-glutamate ligase [Desulfonatronum thiosulfatophilum]|uniref:Ribosomal protein S6--L-glutamate ligase n=1 Tax=Desulfonatronum thiosulfatophilum TaxID=617002 RepID=A0A1G6DIU1_9BACT|nr:ATP-grasp domain-containing protein [Desulfonatronum thiosulfatophilum]SDB45048.1 ribosomal protein S6--L-glutamate ligase [Desulfonatronum thiosulfatophilum]
MSLSPKIAIGRQLRHCPSVHCLRTHGNLSDYTEQELELIRQAPKIYFPTILMAEALSAIGKPIFPSIQTIRYAGDKIRQTQLFQLLGLPMPRTRIYYGPRQKNSILDDFSFPLVAKVPRNSSKGRGVSLIRNQDELDRYTCLPHPAYIQEYLPIRRDIRIVILGGKPVHAYWRESCEGEFRTNISQGGKVVLEPVPDKALELAVQTAVKCRFDLVALDICVYSDQVYLLEANMTFGMDGFKAAGLDFRAMLRDMVENGDL